jgi:putative adhesin Stv-like protein
MTTLVMAHGGRDPKQKELRVPAGMQIDFYADFDENMFFTNGLAVVARGDVDSPNEAYNAGDPIPNYFYQALTSDQLGWYLQLDRSESPAWFVGNELPDNTSLCTDYDNCDAWGANDGSGTHSCDGVLGKAQTEGETHLVILACRGNMEQADQPATRSLVGADGKFDDSYVNDLEGEVTRFIALAPTDQETTWAAYPENTKLTFMAFPWMKTWADAHGATQLMLDEGAENYAVYYATLAQDVKNRLEADPQTRGKAYVGAALKYIADNPAAAGTWFDAESPADQATLLEDPGIAAWHAGRQGDAAQADTAWEPTERDFANVNAKNQSYVKEGTEDDDHPWEAGGFLVLLGDAHDQSFVDWVQGRPDYASGTFAIGRSTFGAGKITFAGAPASHQDTITWAVGQFSDKAVKFE